MIKNFNAYLNHNHNKRYHCRNCITASYTTEHTLEKHMKNCEKNEPMKYKMPTVKITIVGYADFESINIKLNYLNPDLRKQINKLRIKSKSYNVNSKVKNMIINKLMEEQEISKKKNRKEFIIIIFITK